MKKTFTLLAASVLALALLVGCGGQADNSQPPAPDPAPAADNTESDKEEPPGTDPGPAPEDHEEENAEPPADSEPAGEEEPAAPEKDTVDIPPDEPAPDPPEPVQEPEPAPDPDPEPAPAPAETVPEDGTYTANVALEGGTGRARVESPAVLRCEDGKFYATIVWSSPNFDYMKIGGEKYLQTNTEGNSTFEIPVTAFDQKLDIIADTVAMSEPHEVEYTICFDSASLAKQ